MRKTSVSEKMLSLCDLYLQRIEVNLREEQPQSALYWATMVHSQFALARAMADDRQMTSEVFSELNRHDKRALKLIARIGPASGPKMEGAHSGRGDSPLQAYDRFRQEAEMFGVL